MTKGLRLAAWLCIVFSLLFFLGVAYLYGVMVSADRARAAAGENLMDSLGYLFFPVFMGIAAGECFLGIMTLSKPSKRKRIICLILSLPLSLVAIMLLLGYLPHEWLRALLVLLLGGPHFFLSSMLLYAISRKAYDDNLDPV